MGTGSSRTRKLTLNNEDSSNVIKVSDDVVQRLKNDCSDSSQVRSVVRSQEVVPVHPNGPAPIYYYEPRLTSLQFQQEKVEALRKNDQYWEKRIKDLENCHTEMHKVMEGEYNKAIAELNASERKLYACDTPPCQMSKKKVLECYKKNPNQSMKCLKEVQAFTACVDLQRSMLIDAKVAP